MMSQNCCGIHKLSWALVIIGALNWGLIGVAKLNVVMAIFGSWPWLERLIYILVGLAAIAMLAQKACKGCATPGMEKKM